MAAAKPYHLHFLLIPLMSPGHIIPMMDMAKLLCKHGVDVTIVVTPLDATRFGSVINRAVIAGLPIQILKIRFPCEEAGLPAGCESIDSLPSYELIRNFSLGIAMLQPIFEEKLQHIKPSPSCIICDKHLVWSADTCRKFEIPRIIFDGMNCFTQMVVHNLFVSKIHDSVPATELFAVPDLPDKIEIKKLQLPGLLNPSSLDYMSGFREQVRNTESEAYGVVVNSFEELEKRYVDEFKKMKGGKVWCIGPLSLMSGDNLDSAQRGNQASIDTDQCLKWLDSKQPSSVIYACLGSLGRLTLAQFQELALGLEASNNPFILVVNAGSGLDGIEKWMLEDGFEARSEDRCLIIRGWAPQVLILSHPSVGGFLTHCGWNSTLEGVCAGLPMVTWPLFGEQFLNEKLVVQILEIGAGVGAEAVVHLGARPEVMVTRERIQGAVEVIMDKEKEGCDRRKRAREIGIMAQRSVEEEGSSFVNVRLLILDIAKLTKDKDDC